MSFPKTLHVVRKKDGRTSYYVADEDAAALVEQKEVVATYKLKRKATYKMKLEKVVR
jgi:hypothetical protein